MTCIICGKEPDEHTWKEDQICKIKYYTQWNMYRTIMGITPTLKEVFNK